MAQQNYSKADQNGETYAQKFRFMQDEYQQQYDYFTDVDQYSSQENDTVVTVYKNNYNNSNQYAGWGNNDHDVTINYYNNGWYGWNNWYYPYWRYPYYGGGYYNP